MKEQHPQATGDQVWIPDQQRQGTVQTEQSTRFYTLETPAGIIRRNRRDLNILPSSIPVQEESDLPDIDIHQDHSMNTTETRDEPRKSSRHTRPPDRYGVWLNG